ncbi:unnamed protein product [Caenorhabditis auriculariae]|uniref:Uncharacterized protein n=1 Tax=Caenorhabditis auriculariae TaxID=2777116 RepID=A0A8S1HRF7_9PELO|nr:unnamed protein product [Caenorhabditis auriculariae]
MMNTSVLTEQHEDLQKYFEKQFWNEDEEKFRKAFVAVFDQYIYDNLTLDEAELKGMFPKTFLDKYVVNCRSKNARFLDWMIGESSRLQDLFYKEFIDPMIEINRVSMSTVIQKYAQFAYCVNQNPKFRKDCGFIAEYIIREFLI